MSLEVSSHGVPCGGMAERPIAVVLKTIEGNTSGGSNPSPSAIKSSQKSLLDHNRLRGLSFFNIFSSIEVHGNISWCLDIPTKSWYYRWYLCEPCQKDSLIPTGGRMPLTDTKIKALFAKAQRGESVGIESDGGGLNFQNGTR